MAQGSRRREGGVSDSLRGPGDRRHAESLSDATSPPLTDEEPDIGAQ